jgi:hypothetical protein
VLSERVVSHVAESLRKAYAERGWAERDLDSLDRLVRRRAEQINALITQIQSWAEAGEVDYDVLCTLLGHLPSVHLSFENPFMMQMRVPIGELLLTVSDTSHDSSELEGFEVVPNDCPDLQPLDQDDLKLFRKAFEEP